MKKLIHAAVAVACLPGLAGCVTAAQQLAAVQDVPGLGLKPGTEAMPTAASICPGNKPHGT
jgi:hypothetical protein